jgi:pimeloyl-ACP methyl ester carboxylesterase
MRVKINGVQIGYDDFGQGPVVLFIHDNLLDRNMWSPQIEPLVASGFRVILTDLRGCGESDLVEEPVNIQTYSADIIGLLDYLGVGRAAVCELSFGGSVLCNLIENYPQRIAGAYLATSQPIKPPSGRTMITTQEIIGHRCETSLTRKNSWISSVPSEFEYNPITHKRRTDLSFNQSNESARSSKRITGRLVNMENFQEFNRNLLGFLTRLAPRKKRGVLTSLSSAA